MIMGDYHDIAHELAISSLYMILGAIFAFLVWGALGYPRLNSEQNLKQQPSVYRCQCVDECQGNIFNDEGRRGNANGWTD